MRRIMKKLRFTRLTEYYFKSVEIIKRIIFHNLIAKEKWEKAIVVGKSLVKNYPDNSYYFLRLSECYLGVNDRYSANLVIEKGMKLNFDLNKVIKIIQYKLGPCIRIRSKYLQLGGNNNAGCIIHQVEGKHQNVNYLTKISLETSRKKEKLFYNTICKQYPILKDITPRLENFLELDSANVSLITMELIKGDKPIINDSIIQDVIRINKKITSIRFCDIYDWLPHLDIDNKVDIYLESLKDSFAAYHAFISIHKESTNKEIFSYIYIKMEEMNYNQSSFKKIQELEKVIIGNDLYKKIKPESHYSFRHGDFFQQNLLKDEKSGQIYVIDWGKMCIGPRWADIAGFLGRMKLPYNYVNTNYISNKKVSDLELIEEIFFIYNLIIIYFIVLSREEFDNKHETFLSPSLRHLKDLEQKYLGSKTKVTSTF